MNFILTVFQHGLKKIQVALCVESSRSTRQNSQKCLEEELFKWYEQFENIQNVKDIRHIENV